MNCRFKPSVFLKRINRCRGFGIQSPSDFAFVNEVIYQRMPFYAYEELDREFPDVSWFERKICRTLFRISNYAQPKKFVMAADADTMVERYVRFGCRMAKTDNTLYLNVEPQEYSDGDVVIVMDIYGSGKELWQSMIDSRETNHLIVFDLYYFGVAFVRQMRFPELHTVNFY